MYLLNLYSINCHFILLSKSNYLLLLNDFFKILLSFKSILIQCYAVFKNQNNDLKNNKTLFMGQLYNLKQIITVLGT